jgi:hypothetical protein
MDLYLPQFRYESFPLLFEVTYKRLLHSKRWETKGTSTKVGGGGELA